MLFLLHLFLYFGENNKSNPLKSLNFGHAITYNIVFSIFSQYVEFYKVFQQKVRDKRNGTFLSKMHAKSPDEYPNYCLMHSLAYCSS